MKHAVIFAHPRQSSFTETMAAAYGVAAGALGHEVVRRDLYRIGFDPALQAEEMPFEALARPHPDVAREHDLLHDADVFALFYPLWLNTPPAMMKGYLERVFGFGFAYGADGHSTTPLLKGRTLISFTSSGAPLHWLRDTGMYDALRTLFDRHLAELCGLAIAGHVHFGGVVPGASGEFVAARQADVRQAVQQHFGGNR
jgi:NAD(P)H dehydrogenase (quinone)